MDSAIGTLSAPGGEGRRGSAERRTKLLPSGSASYILLASLALLATGTVMVFSASAAVATRFGSPEYFLRKHVMWLLLGCGAFAVTAGYDYRRYRRHARAIFLGSLALLALVFVPGIGLKLNGARRWLSLGGLTFQPSELAKLASVLYLSDLLVRNSDKLDDFIVGFLPPVLAAGALILAVAVEPDVGTAALMCAALGSLLFVGGLRLRHLLPAGGAAAALFLAVAIAKLDYVRARVVAFLDPASDPLGKGYHAMQSLLAIGNGGLTGTGLGRGTVKLSFLPEAHTDFIFSVVGEELGLLGAGAVLALFVVLIYHGMKTCNLACDRYGSLVAFGIVMFLGVQAAMNIAVATASMPTKGIPLPLVSHGGSSMVVTLASMGVLVNVASRSGARQAGKAPPGPRCGGKGNEKG